MMSALTPAPHTARPPLQLSSLDLAISVPVRPAVPATSLLPGVVIPGVSHAGATVLAADLGRHPEVCLPRAKRIAHFTPLRYGRAVEAHLDDYDRHFANWSGQRYRVETATDYFDGGRPLVNALADSVPGVRVVLVLRDPAQRLWASYTDKLARGRVPCAMTFEGFVDRCLALRANGADRFEANRHFRTLSGGYYIEYLPAWLETFGRRARVVFTEDLQDDRAAQVGALFDWLGLNPDAATPPLDGDEPAYLAPEPAPSFNRRLWPVFPRAAGSRRQPDAATGAALRRLPRQSDRVRNRVRSIYAGANRELAALLRDRGYTGLPAWLAHA